MALAAGRGVLVFEGQNGGLSSLRGSKHQICIKGSVAEAVSNGTHIFYGVSWRSMYRFVSTQ